jgi:hypothetical protein
MADFSHLAALRPTLSWYAKYLRQGLPLYDEMLLEALDLMSPPLFSKVATRALHREINPAISRRRGRPRKHEIGICKLLELVRAIDRPGVPAEILKSLICRLERGKAYTIVDWTTEQVRNRQAYDRELLISAVYRGLYILLEAGPERLREVFGDINLGLDFEDLSRHDQATVATGAVMRARYQMDLPGPRRIANIVSHRKIPKTVCVNFA